jgi:hypothetical protein
VKRKNHKLFNLIVLRMREREKERERKREREREREREMKWLRKATMRKIYGLAVKICHKNLTPEFLLRL